MSKALKISSYASIHLVICTWFFTGNYISLYVWCSIVSIFSPLLSSLIPKMLCVLYLNDILLQILDKRNYIKWNFLWLIISLQIIPMKPIQILYSLIEWHLELIMALKLSHQKSKWHWQLQEAWAPCSGLLLVAAAAVSLARASVFLL